MDAKEAGGFGLLIGQAFAGNGRLADGTTLLEKYPERYRNIFTDWVDLLIAEAKARQSLEKQNAVIAPGTEVVTNAKATSGTKSA